MSHGPSTAAGIAVARVAWLAWGSDDCTDDVPVGIHPNLGLSRWAAIRMGCRRADDAYRGGNEAAQQGSDYNAGSHGFAFPSDRSSTFEINHVTFPTFFRLISRTRGRWNFLASSLGLPIAVTVVLR
jgi:hypothetical protein